MKPQNQFLIKAQNEQKIQQSVRIMEYINMYNLKKDEINFQCPIYTSSIHDEDFDLQTECIQEMNDLLIIYKHERKAEFTKIRQEEEKQRTQWLQEEEARRKGSGFFSKLFSSQSKGKNEPSVSPSKLTLKDSAIKSSTYVAKLEKDEAMRLTKSVINNSITQLQTESKEPITNSIKMKEQNTVNKPKIQNQGPHIPLPQNQNQTKAFDNDELIQIDEDDLLNLNDSKLKNHMSQIEEDQGESSSSFRDSKASRVSLEDLQNKNRDKESRGRLSKRSRILDSDQDKEQQVKTEKFLIEHNAFKKGDKKQKNTQRIGQTPNSQKIEKLTKKQLSPKKKVEGWQNQNEEKVPSYKNELSAYIQRQKSRLSMISHGEDLEDSSTYSLLMPEDVVSQQDHNSPVHETEISRSSNSFRSLKIDWFAKIEACQLQERLLMNRFQSRWKKPFKTLTKVQSLCLSDLTQQLSGDPKYKWSRPNLSFGKIVE